MTTETRQFPKCCLIAKFAMHKREIKADGRIRGRLLCPRPNEELSTFEVTELEHDVICRHGDEYVNSETRKQIGYVKFSIDSVIQIGLKPIYDNDPPRHVSIIFPDDIVKRKELGKRLELECLPLNVSKHECFQACCDNT